MASFGCPYCGQRTGLRPELRTNYMHGPYPVFVCKNCRSVLYSDIIRSIAEAKRRLGLKPVAALGKKHDINFEKILEDILREE